MPTSHGTLFAPLLFILSLGNVLINSKMFSRSRMRLPVILSIFLSGLIVSPLEALAQIADNPPYIVRSPSNYNSFLPPPVGDTYPDPVFSTTVKRLSDATKLLGSSGNVNSLVGNEYASINAINADSSLVYFPIGLGGKRLYSINGGLANVPSPDLSFNGTGPLSLQMRWSRTDPNILYYVAPEVMYYTGPDVPGPSYIRSINVKTGEIKTLHTFPQYANLYLTSADLSPDGDYIPILANGRYAFWYRISTDTVGPIIDRTSSAWGFAVGAKGGMQVVGDRFTMFNYASPAYPFGLLVLDRDSMTLVSTVFQYNTRPGVITQIDHAAFGLDADGSPIVIMPYSGYTNCQASPWYVPGYGGVIQAAKWNLRVGTNTNLGCIPTRINVTDFYFSLPAIYTGWTLVTLVDIVGDPSPTGGNPAPQPGWLPMENELFLLKLDGSGQVKRLVHHRGRSSDFTTNPSTEPYGARPKASLNMDGSKAVFGSNYNFVNPTPTGDVNYQDAYLVNITVGAALPSGTALPSPTNLTVSP